MYFAHQTLHSNNLLQDLFCLFNFPLCLTEWICMQCSFWKSFTMCRHYVHVFMCMYTYNVGYIMHKYVCTLCRVCISQNVNILIKWKGWKNNLYLATFTNFPNSFMIKHISRKVSWKCKSSDVYFLENEAKNVLTVMCIVPYTYSWLAQPFLSILMGQIYIRVCTYICMYCDSQMFCWQTTLQWNLDQC